MTVWLWQAIRRSSKWTRASPALDCMPMSVRFKMDLCGLKLSLLQWRALPIDARHTLLDATCESQTDVRRVRRFVELSTNAASGTCASSIAGDPGAWQAGGPVPTHIAEALVSRGFPHISAIAWSGLSDLQRFALWKITAKCQMRNLRPALIEFGLV